MKNTLDKRNCTAYTMPNRQGEHHTDYEARSGCTVSRRDQTGKERWGKMYTTTSGTQWELTPEHWKAIKKTAYRRFDGSQGLFDACWRQYRSWLTSDIDAPENIQDVMSWLDQIASEKVNDPRSKFYMYG